MSDWRYTPYLIIVSLCACCLLLALAGMVESLELSDGYAHVSHADSFAAYGFCSTLFFIVIVDQIRDVLWHYSFRFTATIWRQTLAALKLVVVVFLTSILAGLFVEGVSTWNASSGKEPIVKTDALGLIVVGCFGIFSATWAACALTEKLREIRIGTSDTSETRPPVPEDSENSAELKE